MISILVVLVIAGVALYLLNALIPMDAKFKLVINALIGLFLFLYVLQVLGVWKGGPNLTGENKTWDQTYQSQTLVS